jgi:hypothetical protein
MSHGTRQLARVFEEVSSSEQSRIEHERFGLTNLDFGKMGDGPPECGGMIPDGDPGSGQDWSKRFGQKVSHNICYI